MQWYYSKDGQQLGPVSDAQLLEHIRSGHIIPKNLVWHVGMPEWLPFTEVAHTIPAASSPSAHPPPPSSNANSLASPYAPPNADIGIALDDPELYHWNKKGLAAVFHHTFKLYLRHLWLIVPAYLIIWLPLNFLSDYINYNVLSPDDIWGAIRLAQVLDLFFGVIAVVAVAHICQTVSKGKPCSLGEAMLEGIAKWGKMWITRLLTGLCVLAGFIALIIPGLYLSIRLSFVDYAVAVENLSGPKALSRSFELTTNRFWRTTGYMLIGMMIVLAPSVGAFFLYEHLPVLESWIASAILTTSLAVFEIFFIIYGFAIYKHWDAEDKNEK
jgi:hypothetical protein